MTPSDLGRRAPRAAPALVALAHGSRDPRSAQTIEQVVARVRSLRRDLRVEAAFLDLSSPPFDDVVDSLVVDGTTNVVVVPMLLTEAFHATVDVPGAAAEVQARHPGLRLRVAPVLGTDDSLLDLLDRRLLTATEAAGVVGVDGLVLTSAGSSHAPANDAVVAMAGRWGTRRGLPAAAAFASAASPTPDEAVARLRAAGAGRVGVGRLFLAPGRLADRAARLATEAGAAAVADPLGTDAAVAGLLLERYAAVRGLLSAA